jgi:hypothetical protein
MSGDNTINPGLGDPFALASAHHVGCRTVANFIDQRVRPRIDAVAASNPNLGYLRGILLRVVEWLRTTDKLNEPGDFQAAAAGARAVFEISVDLTLLEFDKAHHTFEKVQAWEASAQQRHGMKLGQYYEGRPGPVPPGVEFKIASAKASEPAAREERARLWPHMKGRHPDRWTGRNLGRDAIEAETLAARGFAEFYANHYPRTCLYVHGSGLARVAGLSTELFPVLSTIAFDTIGRFAIVVAEMTLRLAGHWDTEADRAIQDLAKTRRAEIDKVYAEHPARKGPTDGPAK